MPVVTTIKNTLKGFSDQKAGAIRRRARDTTVTTADVRKTTNAIFLIFDNVQHFHKQRDLRIGRENNMIIGIAATYIQLEVDASACDLLDQRRRIAMNLRKDVSVDQILGLIDQNHLKIVGRLQWIQALVNNIQEPSRTAFSNSLHLSCSGPATMTFPFVRTVTHSSSLRRRSPSSRVVEFMATTLRPTLVILGACPLNHVGLSYRIW
jgi:hypothetical protein